MDEVDMLLEMGFQDTLVKIVTSFNTSKQTLMFSATLTSSKILSLQKLVLKDPEVLELNYGKNSVALKMPTLLKQ